MKSPKSQFLFFLCLFFVVNLLQSSFTGLWEDEAYYWVWSDNLAWGYFDHPPMIALIVKIGYLIFQNELGVRLIPLLMGTITMYLIYLMAEKELKSTSTFVIIISSVITESDALIFPMCCLLISMIS